jgi:LysR family hydrogen peroxide-inducible transcriptional activator
MELHQLKYLTAVADQGSFTRAAQQCLVAQPSLSQQIIKLEKELGQPLLERLGRRVRLTEVGQAFYEQATAILAAVDRAKEEVAELAGEQGGTATVGAIPTIAPYLLPAQAQRFQRRYPRARVIIQEDFTEHTIASCVRGELDVGILALPIPDAPLHVEPLFEEELLVALPARHPLTRKRRLTVNDLNRQPFILIGELHCLGRQIVSFCNQASCSPFMVCRTAQLLTVQELVALGHGISLLPAMACKQDRNPRRVYRRLADVKLTRTLALIWHKHRHQRPVVKQLIEWLRRELTGT